METETLTKDDFLAHLEKCIDTSYTRLVAMLAEGFQLPVAEKSGLLTMVTESESSPLVQTVTLIRQYFEVKTFHDSGDNFCYFVREDGVIGYMPKANDGTDKQQDRMLV